MGKVHKPVPKTIKNAAPEIKKVLNKIVKVNSKKGFGKKVKKALEVVDTKKAENVKAVPADLNKKKTELLEEMKETVSKKKPFVQKSVQNGEAKTTATLLEVPKAVKKVEPKKKKGVATGKQPVQNSTIGKQCDGKKLPLESNVQQTVKKHVAKKNSALTEELEEYKEYPAKKNLVAAKEQTTAKKPVAKKNSALEEESVKDKKEISKKKQVAATQKLPAKKPIAKKNSALEEEPAKDKKEISKKKQVAVKEQPPAKKPIAKKTQVVAKEQQLPAIKPIVKKNSASEEESIKDKKEILKKTHIATKEQLTAKKPIVKKNSASEEESVKDKKKISKKKQVAPKVQPLAKKPVAKQNSALENKKDPPRKATVVAKDQHQPGKKSLAKKNPTLVTVLEAVKNVKPKQNGVEQKSIKEPLALKNLNSKVQKKVSAAKKNDSNLKKKVKKISQKDQNEILKSEKNESPMYEQEDFDEDKFKNIVTFENIKKIGLALKALAEKEVLEKKKGIFCDYRYFLNIACYKIPNCPKRMVKLNLKHALVDTNLDDVVLIVSDLKRGAKVDYEPSIQHYDDILRECGIKNIKVLPFNQLRNEYSSFEAKRKLSNRYDHFLCDGRIVGHVVGFCGKHFQKSRSTIHAVNFSNPKNYKKEIEHGLKRTSYRQLQKGDLTSILVANHRFTADQLAENIENVIEQLKTVFPGGYANIRNIHIRVDIAGTSSLPLYVSLSGAPDEVPNVIGPREERMLKLKKQANDILSKFSMTKTGDFVKLSKTEIKRKQEIRDAREALTSAEAVEDASEFNPPLNKKAKKTIELQTSGDNEVSEDDVDVSEEDDEENGEVSEEESEDGEDEEDDEDGEDDDEVDEKSEDSDE